MFITILYELINVNIFYLIFDIILFLIRFYLFQSQNSIRICNSFYNEH